VLADTALRARDIDEAAALAAKQRAEEALKDKAGLITIAEAQAELVRAWRSSNSSSACASSGADRLDAAPTAASAGFLAGLGRNL